MLVDANLLLYAVDESSPSHDAARTWLDQTLTGTRRVALPWQSLGAFLRVCTHPRASGHPLAPEVAWGYVEDWLASELVWIPLPTSRHSEVLGHLITPSRELALTSLG